MISQLNKNVKSAIYKTISNYLESEFSYIESSEDIYDLESYNCDDDLFNEAYNEGMLAVKDNIDDYDFENNEAEIEDDLSALIDNIFEEAKDDIISKYREKFEMEDMLSEMEEYEEY